MRNVNEIEVVEYFKILRKYIVLLVIVTLVATGVAFVNYNGKKDIVYTSYTGSTEILIKAPKTLNEASNQYTIPVGLLSLSSYIDLMRSDSVLENAKGAEANSDSLKNALIFKNENGSQVISISYTSSNKEEVEQLLTKLPQALDDKLGSLDLEEEVAVVSNVKIVEILTRGASLSFVLVAGAGAFLATYVVLAFRYLLLEDNKR
ncbi:MAG: Wzz/FepE/Etk N-terminal domain-containing protein, partial [Bacilli bacterium]